MPVFAGIPSYESPVFRFLEGRGSLKELKSGAAFTIWEALMHFEETQFPLIVANQSFDRLELLSRVAAIFEEGFFSFARGAVNHDQLRQIIVECIAKGLLRKSALDDYERYVLQKD